jgi:alkanesulfonate monooxygenase SsuD/methylene tetrahydromethanopterin reductase-like flavin-dependent oxidoreductase (luciferase family)
MAVLSIGFKTSPQGVDWPTLDATWARAGELGTFESGWMNDHLTDPTQDRFGSSWEAVTILAALVHRVPGLVVGHGVLSNTFRHPVVLAKQATVLDHATRGRFILGLGAGWHEGEHRPFGIPMPPMPERFDRFESAVLTIQALFSPAASSAPGVDRADQFYPLDGATNEPHPRVRAARRSGLVARSAAASRLRLAMPMVGCCPRSRISTSTTSPGSARRS